MKLNRVCKNQVQPLTRQRQSRDSEDVAEEVKEEQTESKSKQQKPVERISQIQEDSESAPSESQAREEESSDLTGVGASKPGEDVLESDVSKIAKRNVVKKTATEINNQNDDSQSSLTSDNESVELGGSEPASPLAPDNGDDDDVSDGDDVDSSWQSVTEKEAVLGFGEVTESLRPFHPFESRSGGSQNVNVQSPETEKNVPKEPTANEGKDSEQTVNKGKESEQVVSSVKEQVDLVVNRIKRLDQEYQTQKRKEAAQEVWRKRNAISFHKKDPVKEEAAAALWPLWVKWVVGELTDNAGNFQIPEKPFRVWTTILEDFVEDDADSDSPNHSESHADSESDSDYLECESDYLECESDYLECGSGAARSESQEAVGEKGEVGRTKSVGYGLIIDDVIEENSANVNENRELGIVEGASRGSRQICESRRPSKSPKEISHQIEFQVSTPRLWSNPGPDPYFLLADVVCSYFRKHVTNAVRRNGIHPLRRVIQDLRESACREREGIKCKSGKLKSKNGADVENKNIDNIGTAAKSTVTTLLQLQPCLRNSSSKKLSRNPNTPNTANRIDSTHNNTKNQEITHNNTKNQEINFEEHCAFGALVDFINIHDLGVRRLAGLIRRNNWKAQRQEQFDSGEFNVGEGFQVRYSRSFSINRDDPNSYTVQTTVKL
jgi:hypothetical protein